MNLCFFDCESTGLPLNWKAPMQDVGNWPRVISLAWLKTNHEGEIISSHHYLIKPSGWVVPTDKFWVEHGFSQELSEKNGTPIYPVLLEFTRELDDCSTLIAHNISFDYNVVGAELIRAGLKTSAKLQKFCTMHSSTNLCKLPGRYNSYKFPKLEELHQFLFQKSFEGQHDALSDVTACKDCFLELVKRNIIQLNIPLEKSNIE